MRRWSIVLAIVCVSFTSFGQQRTLEELAEETVNALTTAFPISDSLYITLEEYHLLINRQPLGTSDKSEFKREVNDSYPAELERFHTEMADLQEIYVSEVNRGAKIQLDSIWVAEMEGTRNIYEVRIELSFTYIDEVGEEEIVVVFLETMVGTVRRRYSFISPLTESY